MVKREFQTCRVGQKIGPRSVAMFGERVRLAGRFFAVALAREPKGTVNADLPPEMTVLATERP